MNIQKIIKTIYNTLGYEVMAVKEKLTKNEIREYSVKLDDVLLLDHSTLAKQEVVVNEKLNKEKINISFS